MINFFSITFSLTVSLSLVSSNISPVGWDNSKIPGVEILPNHASTSASSKAQVGEFQGDDTILLDEEGNQTTLGELKGMTSGVAPVK
ncbi:hypothetical protein [Saccharibacillus qingshengii]|uniref:hypothetical protein n=1 Tax=Saccharibacillus qingshengii TaxID=1763540 RepID=UPI0015530955|nr:hypothetical protein [Saccharibacillus qingshengii]